MNGNMVCPYDEQQCEYPKCVVINSTYSNKSCIDNYIVRDKQCNGPHGDEESCPIHGEEIRRRRGKLAEKESFQRRVELWCLACFGPEITMDKVERNHRFLEESLELVQSIGCTKSEALQLVEYVFSRPAGEPSQELGGVIVTAAALATAFPMPLEYCGEKELTRVWGKIDVIRAKQAAKPKHSPLPEHEAK